MCFPTKNGSKVNSGKKIEPNQLLIKQTNLNKSPNRTQSVSISKPESVKTSQKESVSIQQTQEKVADDSRSRQSFKSKKKEKSTSKKKEKSKSKKKDKSKEPVKDKKRAEPKKAEPKKPDRKKTRSTVSQFVPDVPPAQSPISPGGVEFDMSDANLVKKQNKAGHSSSTAEFLPEIDLDTIEEVDARMTNLLFPALLENLNESEEMGKSTVHKTVAVSKPKPKTKRSNRPTFDTDTQENSDHSHSTQSSNEISEKPAAKKKSTKRDKTSKRRSKVGGANGAAEEDRTADSPPSSSVVRDVYIGMCTKEEAQDRLNEVFWLAVYHAFDNIKKPPSKLSSNLTIVRRNYANSFTHHVIERDLADGRCRYRVGDQNSPTFGSIQSLLNHYSRKSFSKEKTDTQKKSSLRQN